MKNKLVLFWLLLLPLITVGQVTPNIGLNIPPTGAPNWGVLLNANFTSLDLYLSGNSALPGLKVSGPFTLSSIASGMQCLHVNSSGVVSGTGSDCGSGGGSPSFSAITAGTNTAALVIGSGGTLSFSGTGIINANQLLGNVVAGVTGTGTTIVFNGSPTFTGTVNGNALVLAGNLTTNMVGGPFCVHEIAGVLSATGADCGSSGGSVTAVTGVAPLASTGGTAPAISMQNSAAVNVTAALGTDIKYFTASGSAAVNGDVITGDAQGGINDSGTLLSSLAPKANPTFTGTVNAAAVILSGNLTTNVTGGGNQCLHVNNAGLVTGTGSDCGSGGSPAFSAITAGTNTAALVMGTGGSLTVSGTGTINANQIIGNNITAVTGAGSTFMLNNAPTIAGHPTVEGVTSTGATGTGNFVFSLAPTFTGTITGAALSLSSTLTLSSIASGTQCLHVNGSGVVSGTGSDCGSGGGGAPTTATYILQTANGSLSSAQALGAMATGIMKSTTSTGVVSIAAVADVLSTYGTSLGSCANASATGAVGAVSLTSCPTYAFTLTGNVTSLSFTNTNVGPFYVFKFTQDATGGRTISGVTGVNNFCAIAPAANDTTYMVGTYNGSSFDVTGCSNNEGNLFGAYGTAFSGTPASGNYAISVDGSNKWPWFINDGGTLGAYVQTQATTGGSASGACNASNWMKGVVNKTGAPYCTQPAASDLTNGVSGTGAVALVNAPTFTGAPTMPAPTFNNITGSTQCLHVNSSGVVSGTGSDCGAGGSPAFSAITAGTNTAALVMGTGGSLTTSGTGTINANVIAGTTVSATTGTTNAVFSASPTLTGTVTAAALTLSSTLTTNITGGGTQCVQASNTGVLSGTGAGCGAGGGSTPGSSAMNITPVTSSGGNVTTAQQLMEVSLPAGYLNILNQPYIFTGSGLETTAIGVSPTITYTVKACSVSGCGSGTVITLGTLASTAATANTSNEPWNLNILCVTSTAGSSGALICHGPLSIDLGALASSSDSIFNDTNTTATSTFDLTAAWYIDYFVTFGSGSASNLSTQQIGGVMPQGPGVLGTGTATHLSYWISANTQGSMPDFTVGGSGNHTLAMGASGIFDLSAGSLFKVPVSAGCTVSANGAQCFDSTNKNSHDYTNSVDSIRATWPSSSLPANYAVSYASVSGGNTQLAPTTVPTATDPQAFVQATGAAPYYQRPLMFDNVMLSNAKMVTLGAGQTITGSSTNDLCEDSTISSGTCSTAYTPPSGRIACIYNMGGYNSGATTWKWSQDVSGTLSLLYFQSSTTGLLTVSGPGYCLTHGANLAVNPSNSSSVALATIYEADATSAISSAILVGGVGTSKQTLYTVPASSHISIQGRGNSGGGAASICTDTDGSTDATYTFFITPSGGADIQATQAFTITHGNTSASGQLPITGAYAGEAIKIQFSQTLTSATLSCWITFTSDTGTHE